MRLFDGLERIRQLPATEQAAFEQFYRHQERYRLLPFLADLAFGLAIIGTAVYLLVLPHSTNTAIPDEWYVTSYLYFAFMCSLAALHRWTRLRTRPPMALYLLFALMAAFNYLAFVVQGGGIIPIFGLIFFLATFGIFILSLPHTLIIMGLNLIILAGASHWVASTDTASGASTLDVMMPVLLNWFTLTGLLASPLVAVAGRHIFRTSFALQYLLTETFRSLKQTEAQLIQEQKHQALSHMAKGLLHEIMNPLNCSAQALNFARQTYTRHATQDVELAEALEDAAEQQQRIVRIISDLRSFSASRPVDESEQVNLVELIDRARHFCRNELKGIEVSVQVPNDLSLRCYPSALIQVLVNLLMNSVAALSGREQPRINITSAQLSQAIELRLKDNGHGIAEVDIPSLTEPGATAMQAPDPSSQTLLHQPLKSGLNLGLSICQTIMRHHQGAFSIQSELGAWTEVTLQLPLTAQP